MSFLGCMGAGAFLQASLCGKRGTPWTSRKSIRGPYRDKRESQPFTLPQDSHHVATQNSVKLKGNIFFLQFSLILSGQLVSHLYRSSMLNLPIKK